MGNVGSIGMNYSKNTLKRLSRYLTDITKHAGFSELALQQATSKVGIFLVEEFIKEIAPGKHRKLSRLSLLLRSAEGYAGTPLFRRGNLQRALSSDVLSAYHGRAGLLAAPLVSRGSKKTKPSFRVVGKLLHDGGVIKIRAAAWSKFRKYLAYKGILNKGRKRKLNATSKGTGDVIIRIPPRPFISRPAMRPATLQRMKRIYMQEIARQYKQG
jgi:hypothetical protein